jgi:hypothetical protein
MSFENSAQFAMISNSKKPARREKRAFPRASSPVLEAVSLLCHFYNCAESLLLLYGRVAKLTYTSTKGFRTCKALPPSSPNSYRLFQDTCLSNYPRSIEENVLPGHFFTGTNSFICFMPNWPDARACGTGSWA